MAASPGLRWRLAEDECAEPQLTLFRPEEIVERHIGLGEYRGLEFLHVNARRILNRVPAESKMAFRWTVNVYRGCSHACTYCFARPTHEYLGLGPGEDFERRIVVKVNAVELLAAELRASRWAGETVAMGTNTDPYQRCEGRYHLTQGVVRVLAEAGNPFSILTKSTLILRDLDLLRWASRRTDVRCNLSIGTLDEAVWRATEPGTPPPRRRLAAVRRLNEAGIPTGVLLAPIIPGMSDTAEAVEELAEACLDAGAVSITPVVLHLRPGVREHFLTWLRGHDPSLASELTDRYRRPYLSAGAQRALTGPVDVVLGRRSGAAPGVETSASAVGAAPVGPPATPGSERTPRHPERHHADQPALPLAGG